MSDKTELHDSFVLPFPYQVVDAAIYEYLTSGAFEIGPLFRIARTDKTTGSVRYQFHPADENGPLRNHAGALRIRMINLQQTYVAADYRGMSEGMKKVSQQIMSAIITTCVQMVYRDQMIMQSVAQLTIQAQSEWNSEDPTEMLRTLVENLPQPKPKSPGRNTESYNDWARDQIQQGREREEVFREYARLVDPNKQTDESHLRDQFRKALSRTKRRK